MLSNMEKDKKYYVAGHRGYAAAYPENTLLSFYEAIKLGVDMLEFDIRLSKDRVAMIIHDEKVDRTSNGQGFVAEMTCGELKKFDFGIKKDKRFEGLKIPTFEEFCEMIVPFKELLLNIEIKTSPTDIEATDEIMRIITRYGYTKNSIINSFDANVVAYAKDKYGMKTIGYPSNRMHNFVSRKNGTYSKMWIVGLEMKILTPQIVKEFKDMGIIPASYCNDDEKSVNYSIDCGCKLATCNDPIPCLRVAKQKELRWHS